MLGRYSATARHAGRMKMPQPRWSRCMTLECSLTSMDGRRRGAATASRQVGHVELYLTTADARTRRTRRLHQTLWQFSEPSATSVVQLLLVRSVVDSGVDRGASLDGTSSGTVHRTPDGKMSVIRAAATIRSEVSMISFAKLRLAARVQHATEERSRRGVEDGNVHGCTVRPVVLRDQRLLTLSLIHISE